MADHEWEPADGRRDHWEQTYDAHPGMYGEQSSSRALHAAEVCHAAGARNVLDLGAGHGRDALPLVMIAAIASISARTAARPCTTVLAEPTSGEVHDWQTLRNWSWTTCSTPFS
ncbi:hypothetical protein HRW18_03285 [Streptomyces lunaelactis]|uniref:hypothetical protein n=1 Tax=Streptomyces lunaelactis TaxID=1535768 RepID=UPI0015846B31|nr:hypothetical protein [Streptomyces lunaelactis]NUK01197.1 hypothetical protein [Streptomyces lunaelactis]NUK07051.1 hypothetical protein [Streptomyces lunaelactis]NUK15152.1 hypothetical protein [Streptomyces lunaelactis]NUK56315.1 hypothetical protein [Streptomyces lunaelactis]NUL09117.1 hypothetical protein [Streptomyces lunaelactis]